MNILILILFSFFLSIFIYFIFLNNKHQTRKTNNDPIIEKKDRNKPLTITNYANNDIDYYEGFMKDSALGNSFSTNGINNY